MTDSSFRILIPARLNSTRLPGKALADLGGKPMIVRVLEQAQRSAAQSVHVATDDVAIAEAVVAAGGEVVMTSASHQSGTDRLAEAVEKLGWSDEERVVNVQGDEPAMPVVCMAQVAALLAAHPEAAMATLATALEDRQQWQDPNVVKVLIDDGGRVMLFSRAAIPHVRASTAVAPEAWQLASRHIGLYAYRVSALRAWPDLPQSPLAEAESLEQLRAMAAGWTVVAAMAVEPVPAGVDSPDDLVCARLRYD